MTGANASHAAGQDLAALLHELGKNVGALVVDQIDLFDTKLAHFFLPEKLALAARTSAWSTRTPGTAFAASTARTALTSRITAMAFLPRGRRGGGLRRW